MSTDQFWANADLKPTVKGMGGNTPYLPVGKHKVTLKSLKSLVNYGTKGFTGKIFNLIIIESNEEGVKKGQEYQIAYWQHHSGADKIRTMLKDSMHLDDAELADRKLLAELTDDKDSKIIGLTSTIQSFETISKKTGKPFVNHAWGLFEELEED